MSSTAGTIVWPPQWTGPGCRHDDYAKQGAGVTTTTLPEAARGHREAVDVEAGAEAPEAVQDVRQVDRGLTIAQLLDQMKAAYERTGTANPHRALWKLAAQVIVI